MIYNMGAKEIRKLLRDFYKTRYGKSIFVICYVVPFLFFLVTMGMFIGFLMRGQADYVLVFVPFVCMNMFCVGSYFYYKELRVFAEKRN